MLAISTLTLCWGNLKHVAAFLTSVIFLSCTAEAYGGENIPQTGLPIESVTQISPAGAVLPRAEYQERLLLIDINRQQLEETVLVLEDRAGTLYLWSQDLQRWRLRSPDAGAAIEYHGEKYFPLSAISEVAHVYDPQALTLEIEARPEAFAKSRLTTRYDTLPPPVRPSPGGFINYDLFVSRSTDSMQRSGLFELGYFNRYGSGTSNLLADRLGSSSHATRLDTTWSVDNPEKLRTLHLGDAINAPGAWGRSVRFGGIQFGTNFGTQPGFVTFPSQSIAGQAVLPSTVDVFINNALVSHQSVPPGPFSISNLPVVSGAGEVQLVMRDLLGREQVITRPFYASQTLLREGLKNYSYEFGFVRDNFGIASNNYGSWLASSTYRLGMSKNFTGEVHAEAMQSQTTAGFGGDYLMPHVGTLSTYLAGSHGTLGNGSLAIIGIERQSQPWGLGMRTQWASSRFAQVGQAQPLASPVHSSSLNLSYAAGSSGSVSVAYIGQHNRYQADTRIVTLSYSVSLGEIGSFSLSALRNLTGDVNTMIFALLSIPLSPSTNWSVSSQSMRGGSAANRDDLTTTLQSNLPMGKGYGYRLQARSNKAMEESVSLQNNVGTYTVDAAQSQGSSTTRLSISGGIAILGGDAFFSRRIDQSFAVARIPDYPNVRILADNQPAGRTDAQGNALIPRLRAYDINLISIDQRDVPMDATIGAVKVEAVPYFRSGIDVKFPIKPSHGATLTILLEGGEPLPVGATVQISEKDETYMVGYAGEVYVVGLAPTTRLRATWRGQSCEFDVKFAATSDPLPNIGTYFCKGVQP
jgi:outer membrane usher protein